MHNNSSLAMEMLHNSSIKTSHNYDTRITLSLSLSFFVLTMMVSVFGNLLVIIATYQSRSIWDSNTGVLFANLGVADFLQGAISVPLRIIETFDPGIGSILCRFTIPVSILFGGVSNLAILSITAEKFIAIYWPYAHIRICKREVLKLVILFGWTSVTVFAVASGTCGWEDDFASTCRFPVNLKEEYIWALYTYVHIVPITLVLFLYGFILRASCLHSRRIHKQRIAVSSSSCSDKEKSKPSDRLRQYRAVTVVSIVVGLFLVLVVPIISIDVAEILGAPSPPDYIIQLAVCMIYANNCVNVFVYAGFNQEYRRNFKRILTKCSIYLFGWRT